VKKRETETVVVVEAAWARGSEHGSRGCTSRVGKVGRSRRGILAEKVC
jgi:hypothetical protein